MRHSHRLIINATSVIMKMLVLAAIGLILPPFVLGQIGRSSYGLVILITTFLAFVQLVQIGTPESLGRFVIIELEQGDQKSASQVMSTGFSMLLGFGIIIAGFVSIAIIFPQWFIKIPENMSIRTIRILIAILGIATAINMPLSYGHVLFRIYERFVIHSFLQTLGFLARLVLVFALLTAFSGSLLAFALGTVGGNIFEFFLVCVVGYYLFPQSRLKRKSASLAVMKKIIGYGLLVLLNTFSKLFFVQANYIVIGWLLDNEQVTFFNLGVQWVLVIRNYVDAALSVLTPSATRTEAVRKNAFLQMMLLRSTKYGLLASLLPMIFLLPFRFALMRAWVGDGYSISATILLFIVLGDFFANGTAGGISMLTGIGKLSFLCVSNLIVGLVNITLGIFLFKVYNLGLMSFAYAYFIVFLIRNGILIPIYLSRIFDIKPSHYLINGYLRPIYTAAVALPIAYGIYTLIQPTNWSGLIASAVILTGCFIPITYFLGLDNYDRTMFKQMIAKVWVKSTSFCNHNT